MDGPTNYVAQQTYCQQNVITKDETQSKIQTQSKLMDQIPNYFCRKRPTQLDHMDGSMHSLAKRKYGETSKISS